MDEAVVALVAAIFLQVACSQTQDVAAFLPSAHPKEMASILVIVVEGHGQDTALHDSRIFVPAEASV
ncbi:hypothetical protein F442_19587 [Phytophthora nicotianae P10297]|uniref:RxLR effector protein n=1 Tax=Phytophthora nicotianae P10297 TaxID=1317064 RepID=W2YBH6_PHYNI|nr:hypothetical protein F442_19587 [Phytophthora nicotianae P10297]